MSPSTFHDTSVKSALRKQTINHPLVPTQVTLADNSPAVAFPLTPLDYIPLSLLTHLTDEFNDEIERGQTYPLEEPLTPEGFKNYWMGDFTAILLKGTLEDFEKLAAEQGVAKSATAASLKESDPSHLYDQYHESGEPKLSESARLLPRDAAWSSVFLGTFHVLPNYPGRSSHVCNCGFLVAASSRGQPVKVGSVLGQLYLDWAPKLGYTYSMYNLVYETNEFSVKIWENLGFEKIGRVPGAGILKGYDEPVDALIFGKKLA